MKGKDIIKDIHENKVEDYEVQLYYVDGPDTKPNIKTIGLKELGDIGHSSREVYLEADYKEETNKRILGKELISLIESNNLQEFTVFVGYEEGYYPNMKYKKVRLKGIGEQVKKEKVAYLFGELE